MMTVKRILKNIIHEIPVDGKMEAEPSLFIMVFKGVCMGLISCVWVVKDMVKKNIKKEGKMKLSLQNLVVIQCHHQQKLEQHEIYVQRVLIDHFDDDCSTKSTFSIFDKNNCTASLVNKLLVLNGWKLIVAKQAISSGCSTTLWVKPNGNWKSLFRDQILCWYHFGWDNSDICAIACFRSDIFQQINSIVPDYLKSNTTYHLDKKKDKLSYSKLTSSLLSHS